MPALRVNTEPAAIAELEQIVSSALGGRRVTLADDVLTESSLLVIERNRLRRFDGPLELGRDLGRPERFQLLLEDSQCYLRHEQPERYFQLSESQCIPEH